MKRKSLIVDIKDLDKILPLIDKYGINKLIKMLKSHKKKMLKIKKELIKWQEKQENVRKKTVMEFALGVILEIIILHENGLLLDITVINAHTFLNNIKLFTF